MGYDWGADDYLAFALACSGSREFNIKSAATEISKGNGAVQDSAP